MGMKKTQKNRLFDMAMFGRSELNRDFLIPKIYATDFMNFLNRMKPMNQRYQEINDSFSLFLGSIMHFNISYKT